jgi:cell wall-associated NlpC family hydrolase
MFIFSFTAGVLFGIIAICLYAMKLSNTLVNRVRNKKPKTSLPLTILGISSTIFSGINFLVAFVTVLISLVLVLVFTSPAYIASTIIKTGGDPQGATQPSVNTAQVQQEVQKNPVNANASQQGVIDYATSYVGKVPYVWGGTTTSGWDCSGFTMYVFGHFGIKLPHNDASQASLAQGWGARDDASNPKPGDLMRKPGHVAIYIGNGMMVEAANPRLGTRISKVPNAKWEYYNIIEHHG